MLKARNKTKRNDEMASTEHNEVQVRLQDEGDGGARFAVEAPSALRASAALGASRGQSADRSGQSTSRGSTVSEPQARESFLITVVSENRAREIGICAIDLVAPHELLLWSIIDSHSYTETVSLLLAYQPVEVLVVEAAKPQRVNDAISKRVAPSTCRMVPIARKYFDQTRGAEDLKRVMANRADSNITKNYVLMAAVSCLMRYVEFIQGVFIAEKSMKVVANPSLNKLLMDQATVSSLELIQCATGDSARPSLWKIINNTRTSAGNRLLRSTMLQPPRHLKTIRSRQEIVRVFLGNPGWFFDLIEELPSFVDLDRLLGQLVLIPRVLTPRVSRLAVGNIIALKQTLACIPSLSECIERQLHNLDEPSPLLKSLAESLNQDSFNDIRKDIDRVINERVKVCRAASQRRIQECFAVRAGIDGMLDVARRTYLDTIEQIHALVHDYKERLEIPVRLNYTSRRGYHLLAPGNCKSLPSLMIECVPSRKVIVCSTKELNSLNTRLNEALMAVYKLSNGVIQDLLGKIRQRATVLYSMVESVALLDMLLSFANVVALAPADQPYVCPRVTESGSLVIKGGRHPIVEHVLKHSGFIANNTQTLYMVWICAMMASKTESNVEHLVLTGPNCAGKSTHMRSIALITILAQMGCFVPASDAVIPLRDRICTRFGTSDDMEENASTFLVEMNETSFILESCTPKSLVLVDELGRGTSSDEGFALAWSVAEELISKRVYTCFATHYHGLHRLSELYSNCRSYHMTSRVATTSLQFQYKLVDGPSKGVEMYGIQTARVCGIPPSIIQEAQMFYEQLMRKSATERSDDIVTASNDSEASQLIHQLLALQSADLDDKSLRHQLQHLKSRYIVQGNLD